jgi:hypothetical protein
VLGLTALLATLSACGPADGTAALMAIVPASPEVAPGESVQFASTVPTVEPVVWAVVERDGGTIDGAGLYTAPGAEGTYTVTASVASLSTQTTLVRVKRNIRVDLSPSTATLGAGQSLALTATVTGSVKTVTWSVAQGDAGGTVTAAGVYTAPQSPGVYTVVATSTADTAKTGTAAITVTAAPPPPPPAPVTISVSPSAASVVAGSTLQLTASVGGATNVGVTWAVTESGGGTVSASGVYAAPTTAGTYHVVATSQADPTKTSAATVTVTAPPAPTPTPTPTGPQFFVATTGNDANPGTDALPWRTIQKAMNSATAGSTVNIKAGTYRERLAVNVSGTSGSYITFQPYGFTGAPNCGGYTGVTCGGDQVILDYAYLGTVSDMVPFLAINGRAYVRVQGLTFQNYTTSGGGPQRGVMIYGSHDVEILHNKFLRNRSTSPWGDVTAAFAHFYIQGNSPNVTVRSNEFGSISTAMSECLSAWGATGPIYIEKNWLHDIGGIAIDVTYGGNNVFIRANLLEFVGRTRTSTAAIDNNPAAVIYVDGGNTSVIERNIIRDSAWAIVTSSEQNYTVRDIVIRDNVMYRNRVTRSDGSTDGGGVFAGSWYTAGPVYGVTVSNNTMFDNHKGAAMGASSSVTWRNNIIAGNTIGVLTENTTGVGHTFSYNLVNGNGSSWYGSATQNANVTTAPQFVDAAAGNLAVQTSSPARDAGDVSFAAGTGETDAAGKARVVNGRVDIGAYEVQ